MIVFSVAAFFNFVCIIFSESCLHFLFSSKMQWHSLKKHAKTTGCDSGSIFAHSWTLLVTLMECHFVVVVPFKDQYISSSGREGTIKGKGCS